MERKDNPLIAKRAVVGFDWDSIESGADEPFEDFDYDRMDGDSGFESSCDRRKESKEQHLDVLEFSRKLIRYIRSKPRARLTVDCLCIAIGDSEVEGVSMTELAVYHGITKAAISKRVKEIQEELHLPTTRYNKSDAASRTYALRNRSQLSIPGLE